MKRKIEKYITKAFLISILFSLCTCNTVEIRSPIVFKKSKPKEQPASPQEATIASTPKKSEVPPSKPASIPPSKETTLLLTEKESPKIGSEFEQVLQVQEEKNTVLSPADISLLSPRELSKYQFSTLGHIEVKLPSQEEFNEERAIQDLKIEAYKRYGSLAHGITNVEYNRGISGLISFTKGYKSISADVVSLIKKDTPVIGKMGNTQSRVSPRVPGEIFLEKVEDIPELSNIALISSKDLFHRNFKILGTVTVFDESRKGFSEDQALKNLKIEAFRLYGKEARGLTKIKLIKEARVFYYKKTQSNLSPKEPEGFIKATAEVVSWPLDSKTSSP